MANDFQKDVDSWADRLQIAIEEKVLQFLESESERQIDITQDRTFEGYDYEGDPFTEYAEFTKRDRAARGRLIDHVYLFDYGNMFGAMFHEEVIEPGEIISTIDFRNDFEREKAAGHQFGLGKLPVREWLGFTPQTEAEMLNNLRKKLNEL